jgi:hypothetical protein
MTWISGGACILCCVIQDWNRGLDDIRNVARHPDGTFFYSWFKGLLHKP